MLLDSAQVAAEPLEGRLRPASDGQLVPLPRDRPLRRGDVEPGRREAIRKHLVDDGLEMPVRAAVAGVDDEVVGVGDVERLHAGPV